MPPAESDISDQDESVSDDTDYYSVSSDQDETDDDAGLWKILQLSKASDVKLEFSPFEDAFLTSTLYEWRDVYKQLSGAAQRRGMRNILCGDIRPIMKYFLSNLLYVMTEHVNSRLVSDTVGRRVNSVSYKDVTNFVRVELLSSFTNKSPDLLYRSCAFGGAAFTIMHQQQYNLIHTQLQKADSEKHEP